MASWASDISGARTGRAQSRADPDRAPSGALLVEVAWEVCNQLGGIYQVIKSKAPRMVNRWKNRYFMLGPYNHAKAALEFEERPVKPNSWLGRALEQLRSEGLIVHHGHWLVPGRPKVLLIEHGMPAHELDKVKYRLFTDHGIEFPAGDWLIDGVVSFAEASRRVLWVLANHWSDQRSGDDFEEGETHAAPRDSSRRVLAHFHEWMGGLAIPMLRKEHAPIATIFTTHATQLGRTLAFGDEWFYEHLPFVDQAAEAARCNVKTQHFTERACAHGAHVFTTVSPITGEECTHLLGRSPDMILANGLSIENYNVGHEFQTFHATFKDRIHRFTMGHFFPSYSFDLDKTLYFFTSGRYEPRNKGFDLCIEAMARLNAELKAQKVDRNVVFFIVTQRPTRSLHPRVLQSRGVLNELENVCDRVMDDVGEKLFRRAAAGERVKLDDLVSEYWRLRFRRNQHALKTDQLPMIVTHLLEDDHKDDILNQIRNVWLFNRHDDPVKIVYHPEFISPTNPLWGIEYEQFVRGCHMGVFPSAYEPWGYTPLECMAMGVPSITSDLAGFGRYVEETHPEMASGFRIPSGTSSVDIERVGSGLTVLKRRGRTFGEAAGDLAHHLLEFCKMDRRSRIALRNQVEQRSWEFDWSELGKAYDWAHDLALVRAGVGG